MEILVDLIIRMPKIIGSRFVPVMIFPFSTFPISTVGNQNIFHEITFTKWIKFLCTQICFGRKSREMFCGEALKTSALDFLVSSTCKCNMLRN